MAQLLYNMNMEEGEEIIFAMETYSDNLQNTGIQLCGIRCKSA